MWLADSVLGVLGFSCLVACGILVPPPRIKPTSPALQGRFLTSGPLRKVPVCIFKKYLVVLMQMAPLRDREVLSGNPGEEI